MPCLKEKQRVNIKFLSIVGVCVGLLWSTLMALAFRMYLDNELTPEASKAFVVSSMFVLTSTILFVAIHRRDAKQRR